MDQPLLIVAVSVLLVVAVLLVVLLVRQRGITARARAMTDALHHELRAHQAEQEHLTRSRLPSLIESIADPAVSVPGPLAPGNGDPHGVVLSMVADYVRQARSGAAQAAASTLKAMMRSVQNLANEQQVAISEAEQRHDDPAVLADLLKIDHANSQLARRAQATAVLCGSWPGQQRSASTLTDVARGATSRIRDFPRVAIPATSDTAVVSRAVEPVVLAVAELLDNGARHSQPGSKVEVNFQQAHNGLAIVIDDAGVGMTVEAVQRATWLLAQRGAQDIAGLGDPPRIGFAVIGILAARYGFSVSVDTRSPYGGVRAVVFLPSELLTRESAPSKITTPVSRVLEPGRQDQPPEREPAEAKATAPAEDLGRTENGLPRRRRRAPAAEFAPPPPARAEPAATQTPATLAAWQRGTRAGRETTPAPADFERDTQ
ncbi:ATP-binding protein [Amycolatopsis minnesotensis]|uniref:histidine kinase n=1 Tax=Amycolatopsis minnesotensis TaxID=337894 RepID=A0ABP5D155_9PSEU